MNAHSLPRYLLDTDAQPLSDFSEQLTTARQGLNRLEQNLWRLTLQIAERTLVPGAVTTVDTTYAKSLAECNCRIQDLSKALCASSSSHSSLQSNLTKVQKLQFKYFKTVHLFHSLHTILHHTGLGTRLENHKRWTIACEAIMSWKLCWSITQLTAIAEVINRAHTTLKPTPSSAVVQTPETKELVSFFKACLSQLEKRLADSRIANLKSKVSELDAAETQETVSVDDLSELISQMSITDTDTRKQSYITKCLSSDTDDSALMFAGQSWYISWPGIGYRPILPTIRSCEEAAKILRQLRKDIDADIQLLLEGHYSEPTVLRTKQALYESVSTDVEARLTTSSNTLLQKISEQTHYGLNYISMLRAVLNDAQSQQCYFVKLCNTTPQTPLWALQRAMQHTEDTGIYDLYLAAKAFKETAITSTSPTKFEEMQQQRLSLVQQALAKQAQMTLEITDADNKWYRLICSNSTPDRLQALLQKKEEIETVVDGQAPKLQEGLKVALLKPMINFLYFTSSPNPDFNLVLYALEQDPQLAASLVRAQVEDPLFAEIYKLYRASNSFQKQSTILNQCVTLSALLDELEALPFEKNMNTTSLYYQCWTLFSFCEFGTDQSYLQLKQSLSSRLTKFFSSFTTPGSSPYITSLSRTLWSGGIQGDKPQAPTSPGPEESWLTQLYSALQFLTRGEVDEKNLGSLAEEYLTNEQTQRALHRQFGVFVSERLLYGIKNPVGSQRTDSWKHFMKLYAEYISAARPSDTILREACALARSTTGEFDRKIISLGLSEMHKGMQPKPSLSVPTYTSTTTSAAAAAAAAAASSSSTVSYAQIPSFSTSSSSIADTLHQYHKGRNGTH